MTPEEQKICGDVYLAESTFKQELLCWRDNSKGQGALCPPTCSKVVQDLGLECIKVGQALMNKVAKSAVEALNNGTALSADDEAFIGVMYMLHKQLTGVADGLNEPDVGEPVVSHLKNATEAYEKQFVGILESTAAYPLENLAEMTDNCLITKESTIDPTVAASYSLFHRSLAELFPDPLKKTCVDDTAFAGPDALKTSRLCLISKAGSHAWDVNDLGEEIACSPECVDYFVKATVDCELAEDDAKLQIADAFVGGQEPSPAEKKALLAWYDFISHADFNVTAKSENVTVENVIEHIKEDAASDVQGHEHAFLEDLKRTAEAGNRSDKSDYVKKCVTSTAGSASGPTAGSTAGLTTGPTAGSTTPMPGSSAVRVMSLGGTMGGVAFFAALL